MSHQRASTTQAPVVLLNARRSLKQAEEATRPFHAHILNMGKLELLEEMVKFQEERTQSGQLTLPLMVKGLHLFEQLEKQAETRELKLLTGSYRRHLELELKDYLKTGMLPAPLAAHD